MAEFERPPKGTKDNPAEIGPFPKGMNNVQPTHALPDGFARNVINADVTDVGSLRRRDGYERQLVGANISAAWAYGDDIYFVDSGSLYKTAPGADGGLAAAEIVPNNAGALLSRGATFVEVAGTLVLGDPFSLFGITPDGLERFTHDAPGITAVSAAAGSKAFLVAVTGALANSETQPSRVERVVGEFPITVSLAAYDYPVNVYVSWPDGALPYWRAQTSGSSVVVNSTDLPKRPMPMGEHVVQMPPGSIMRYDAGRLFSVVGAMVFYSLPYYPSVCSAIGGFLPFPRDVTAFEPIDAGLVVATDREIGLVSGQSPDSWEYNPLANYGAVPGTAYVHKDGTVFLMTAHGQVSISKAGEFRNLHEGKVAVGLARAGASGFVADNGLDRVVTSLSNPETSRTEATTFMEFEVIRKEVIV